MRTRIVTTLLKKEFINIVRDRKSLIILILLPLLSFPVMIGLMSFLLSSFTKIKTETITFGTNYEISENFRDYIDNYEEENNCNIESIYDTKENLIEKFDNNEINAFVIKVNESYEIHYDENNTNLVMSNSIVHDLYNKYQESNISNVLVEDGIDYETLKNTYKVDFVQENVTEMGSFVPSLIAMVLITMISSTCFSIAIEVTTSEKEKGTLETLLSLPIKKAELITSKYIVVFLLSSLSGILAYISLFGTIWLAGDTLALLGVTSLVIDIKVLLVYLIAILLVSLLFSGLILSVTIFSKNLKEAQNSLYPFEIVVVIVSMLPMLGINASIKNAIIPFVNISLLFNNVLASNIDVLFIVLTFVSSIVYAVLLVLLLSNIYSQEDVLFNSRSISNTIFKNGKQKTLNFGVVSAILMGIIIFCLSLYFSIIFISASKYVLISIMPITIAIVLVIACLLAKIDFKKSFKVNKFTFRNLSYSFMLYVGTYFLVNYLITSVISLFPSLENNAQLIDSMLSINNVGIALLLVAVLPAIFEELLFRGVIFNSFNKKYGFVFAMVISSLIFGVYHMNWIQGIFAFVLGLVLAYSYYKSNSIFVPMIIHFINNAFAVLMDHYDFMNFSISNGISIFLIASSSLLIFLTIYNFNHKLKK